MTLEGDWTIFKDNRPSCSFMANNWHFNSSWIESRESYDIELIIDVAKHGDQSRM